MYMCFKELALALLGDGESVICRVGWQAGFSGRISVTVLKQNFFFGKSMSSQFLHLRSTTLWVKLPHIIEYNLLYLKSTDSKS